MRKLYVLYDGRAKGGNTEGATVLITADSEREVYNLSREYFNYDAVWYEYEVQPGGVLVNEKERRELGVPFLLKNFPQKSSHFGCSPRIL